MRVGTNSNTAAEEYGEYVSGSYMCVLDQLDVVESSFKDEKTGETKLQVEFAWKVVGLTQDQQDEGLKVGKIFRQWVSLYYGVKRDGQPAMLKKLIDDLADEAGLELGDDWDTDEVFPVLLAAAPKRRITVTGPNDRGYFKVAGVDRPRRAASTKPTPPAAPPQRAAARKNVPVAVAAPEDPYADDETF